MILEFIRKRILPRSHDRDKARQEFILNILLAGSLIITFFAFFVVLLARYNNTSVQHGLAPFFVLLSFLFFLGLYSLSRKGMQYIAALFLLGFFYIAGTYTIFSWGIGVVQAWLIYALLIVMSGVLVGTRFAFFLTLAIVVTVLLVSSLQFSGFYNPSISWEYTFGDTILLNITLIVIAIIAWLSNREIEKSLIRARTSEAALKKERDLLEIKVEERTRDLKQAQLEKVTQLYRFAEIGRLSSGVFHDLMTPLSLISLHLERLKNRRAEGNIEDVQKQLEKAIKATRYLETFIKAVRKQLQNQASDKLFSLNKEIRLVIQMLRHKANSSRVRIIFQSTKEIKLYGDQIKFSQLMINLILNAIDAYEDVEAAKREIDINLSTHDATIVLTVRDNGVGIVGENLKKIFQPFFTTKHVEKGTGIGLSISREIVEKHFGGAIFVRSSNDVGTIFTITFPLKKVNRQIYESFTNLTSSK